MLRGDAVEVCNSNIRDPASDSDRCARDEGRAATFPRLAIQIVGRKLPLQRIVEARRQDGRRQQRRALENPMRCRRILVRHSIGAQFRANRFPWHSTVRQKQFLIGFVLHPANNNAGDIFAHAAPPELFAQRFGQHIENATLAADRIDVAVADLKQVRAVLAVERERVAQNKHVPVESRQREQILVGLKAQRFRHWADLAQDSGAIGHPARAEKTFPQPKRFCVFGRRDAKTRSLAQQLRVLPAIGINLGDTVADQADLGVRCQRVSNRLQLAWRPPVVAIQERNDLAHALRNAGVEG